MAGERLLRAVAAYSAAVGVLYVAYGLAEIAAWVFGGLGFPPYASPSLMGGFVLLVIGSVLLYRAGALVRLEQEGLAFLFTGLLLSAMVGVMYLLIIGADALDAAIVGEEWEFDAAAYNLPAIMLFILLLPGWIVIREKGPKRAQQGSRPAPRG
ncbi:hypothetical protein [Stetteria hydrogenophila]